MNEQNQQGVGFYNHMGFQAIGWSEFDEQGRPFPIVNLVLNRLSHKWFDKYNVL